ncbi:MAG: 5'-methylthioadenosine/adenosylhomocysteine nucleosidase [Clostridia bacterium]|nr:5'-methylthioadenosine/adenosylhomocysteine nucleosidase [Clostridia bacterium]
MIGIIGAMDIEVSKLKSNMTDARTVTASGIDFIAGKLFDHDAVVAKCGVGKINAALCTEAMILKFSPDMIINTGIAGSLSEKLSVLDVAVARSVVLHDFDITYFGYPRGLVPGVDTVEIPSDVAISKAIEGIVKGMGIGCEYGVIATGDQFICSDEKKEELFREFSAIACEMEGGAIGQVCHINKVPFTIIRAISDSANGANMDYETFSERAADISSKIVENFIMSI